MFIRSIFIYGCLPLVIVTAQAVAEEKPGPFDAQLLAIANEYPRYGRVDDETRWSPELCRQPNPSTARFSQSDEEETHGQKLYFLFAKNRKEYMKLTDKLATTGQVVVKEAWKPKEVPDEEKPKPVYEALKKLVDPKAAAGNKENESLRGTYLPYAKKEGKLYKAHEKAGLYIMLLLDPKTEGTDEGWVYGTVTPDGKTVTSAGRVESCIKCHADAPYGRLFGLPPKK